MTYRANNIVAGNVMTFILQNLESDMVNVGWINVASQVAGNFTPNAQNNGVTATNANVRILVDVFKSNGAQNAIGNDWYVYLATDLASNTYLFVTMSQAFNVSTNLVTNYPPSNVTAATLNVYTNQFCTNANTTNMYFSSMTVSGGFFNNGSNARIFSLNTSSMLTTGNGTNFYYTVTLDRLIVSVANNTNATVQNTNGSCFYIGTYDSTMPLSIDQYPLVLANIAAVITEPIATQYQGLHMTEPVFAANSSTPAGFAENFATDIFYAQHFIWASGATHDAYQANTPSFARMVVIGWGGSGSSTTGTRGLLRDCYITNISTGRGDILWWTFNGAQTNTTCMGAGTQVWSTLFQSGWGPIVAQV